MIKAKESTTPDLTTCDEWVCCDFCEKEIYKLDPFYSVASNVAICDKCHVLKMGGGSHMNAGGYFQDTYEKSMREKRYKDFVEVTECQDEEVSKEQVERIYQRYTWGALYCQDQDVLEVGCGSGLGLGYLAKSAKTIQAVEPCQELVTRAKKYYCSRIKITKSSAEYIPYPAECFDVVILFEAIYYLHSLRKFLDECRRILRPKGVLLIAMANKDVPGFTPSPMSRKYYTVPELNSVLRNQGFSTNFFGNIDIGSVSLRQKLFLPLKRLATFFKFMPETKKGKLFYKRLMFGRLVRMPCELTRSHYVDLDVTLLRPTMSDTKHKVIFCEAKVDIESEKG